MGETIALLDEVSYFYPKSKEPVLTNISFQVQKGEFLGVIGPTGAGKSTLCLAFNGIVPQFFGGRFFGSVTVAGRDTVDTPISVLARYVGQVFEDPETQIIATSVENEIAFALENLQVPRDEIMARIPRVLEMVRLENMNHKIPAELSGGQKQRLAIAAALAIQPELLVLDEPTSQLDPVGAQEVFATVKELNKELGMTIVMASHAAEEMAENVDRVILLSRGVITIDGTPDNVYSEVELLRENSLRPPQVTSVFYSVAQKGIPLVRIPVQLEDGYKALPPLVKNITPPQGIVINSLNAPSAQNWAQPVISVRDLHYVYPDGTQALRGVSLGIHRGEYVLIAGQNGAGKSTLVKHFLNLLKPIEGSVLIDGSDSRNISISDLAGRIGYVAQNPASQIFNSTVEEEVAFALRNLKYSTEEVETRTLESLSAMGLLEMRHVHPLSLPKGDRARVVIAAILAMKPEVIIFDEPTTGQDYQGANYILEISRMLHRQGRTVIVITHHLYLMPEYAERVIVMGKGTILLDAPVRSAFHQVDLLRSTYLVPPQAVLIAQEMGRLINRELFLLTPEEVANCFHPVPAAPILEAKDSTASIGANLD